jgi:GNAT superfamily N-acetyltransferase
VDFPAISDFLYGLYQPDNRDGNWLQPVWEYAYTHPWFDEESVSQIGIWEDDGTMVAVALYELRLGEAFFQIHPDYVHLKPEMLTYAEQHLTALTEEGKRYLKAYVNDFDGAFAGLWFDPVNELGYVEPVATDPDYRRMGLGTAAVLEGIRRCGELGASVAYVGSERPFYRAMGFQKLYTSNCWIKWF